ncbi:hypothetical protein C8R45DRAFT_934471 [Mycena sanguinolenta]|nr:hypothetical protein C8R45DRAFT_934471 [Mycena sanguinolenta]
MPGPHERKRPPDRSKNHKRSPDAKEKRRQRDAKRRQIPGVLEKQRMLMAERRAAVKARRRQWDPPKHPRKTSQLTSPLPLDADIGPSPAELDVEPVTARDELTSAEQFALSVLSEMAAARSEPVFGPVPPPVRYPAWDPSASDSYGISDTQSSVLSSSVSFGSSIKSVYNESIWRFVARWSYSDKPLPPYVNQPTLVQKKIWRDLGKIGPLNFVQQQQLIITKLWEPMTALEWEQADELPPVPVMAPQLSSQRRKTILKWRRQPDYDTTWDETAQREFAEATLARRSRT